MSAKFPKRIKKGSGTDPLGSIGVTEESEPTELPAVLRPARPFEFKKKSEDKKQTPLDKKFAEVGLPPKADPQAPLPAEKQASPNEQTQKPGALSFLESDDPEAQYLKCLIGRGQRIVEEHAKKQPVSTGMVEIRESVDEKLGHMATCEKAFNSKIEEMLRDKLFGKKVVLIPEEDVVAKGDIFAVPKHLAGNQEEEGSLQDKIKRFLERGR